TAAFLLPDADVWPDGADEVMRFYFGGEFFSNFDIPVLDLKRKGTVASDCAAYARFQPDLIIDDCSLVTGLARQVKKIPRVTLLRNGAFRVGAPAVGWRHSLDSTIRMLPDMSSLGFDRPRSVAD